MNPDQDRIERLQRQERTMQAAAYALIFAVILCVISAFWGLYLYPNPLILAGIGASIGIVAVFVLIATA